MEIPLVVLSVRNPEDRRFVAGDPPGTSRDIHVTCVFLSRAACAWPGHPSSLQLSSPLSVSVCLSTGLSVFRVSATGSSRTGFQILFLSLSGQLFRMGRYLLQCNEGQYRGLTAFGQARAVCTRSWQDSAISDIDIGQRVDGQETCGGISLAIPSSKRSCPRRR